MGGSVRRILLVSPGHSWSTYDAFTGLHNGFKAIGVETYLYDLERRIPRARDFLAFCDGEEAAEDMGRVVYCAGEESIARALAIAADGVVVVTGLMYDPRLYVLLARARLPVFLFGTESPYNDDFYRQVAPSVAAFSTNEASSASRFRDVVAAHKADTRVLHLPLGYDPQTHYPGYGTDADGVATHDVVFVGNVYPSRAEMLAGASWDGIDLGLYGVFEMIDDADWPLWPFAVGCSPGQRSAPVDNRIAASLYSRAKITLNLFRREKVGRSWDDVRTLSASEAGQSINPRMIEAAAMGCFMLSEWRPEVEQVFGDAVPTFRTPDELERLVRYYLTREDERRAMAARLPALVSGYSYHERARTIADTLAEIRGMMTRRAA